MKRTNKIIFALLMVLAVCVSSFTVFGDVIVAPRLSDGANLLSESEASSLLEKLNEISDRQKVDVVVATVDTTEELSIEECADLFYELSGFGFGTEKDGLLLLVDKGNGKWHISTSGYAIEAFTDEGIEYIGRQIKPFLSDGDFNGAFVKFAELCDDFITQARTGEPYTKANLPREALSLVWIPLSLIIGFIIALIVVGNMKGKLKSVRTQTKADSYVKKDSMNLTDSRDLFLYRTLTKTKKANEQKSSDSSTHESESGKTHGGGGGSF